jgi:hypothetical protein
VRNLLIRGANREAVDKKGKKPIDLVEDISDSELQQ